MNSVLYMINSLQQVQKKFAAEQEAWATNVQMPARKVQQIRKFNNQVTNHLNTSMEQSPS
jgi:hypothetical protein